MLGFLILLGILLILFPALKPLLERVHFSPIPVCIGLGCLLHFFLPNPSDELTVGIRLLGSFGLVLLLFQIGLEANLKRLLRFLGRAGILAACNMLLSALLGIAVIRLLGFSWEVAIFVGVAISPTSMAVALPSWDSKTLSSPRGLIFVDMVTVDSIAAILFMVLLLGSTTQVGTSITVEIAQLAARLIVLLGICYLFSHFIEERLVKRLFLYEKLPDSTLTVIAISLLIAVFAAWLGFSLAIGAFFAGIAFSRDPKAVKIDAAMEMLYDLFTPFFFLWIGFQTTLAWGTLPLLLLIFSSAIIGKVFGTFAPARLMGVTSSTAWLYGLGAIPRAEICTVIAHHGLQAGILNQDLYSTLALVALLTSLLSPILTRWKLQYA